MLAVINGSVGQEQQQQFPLYCHSPRAALLVDPAAHHHHHHSLDLQRQQHREGDQRNHSPRRSLGGSASGSAPPSALAGAALYPEFLPSADVLALVAERSASSAALAAVLARFCGDSAAHRQGPDALRHASLWTHPTFPGEFDYLLYNYLLICTLDKGLASKGLRQRLLPEGALGPPGAPGRTISLAPSCSLLGDDNEPISWASSSIRSSTPSVRRNTSNISSSGSCGSQQAQQAGGGSERGPSGLTVAGVRFRNSSSSRCTSIGRAGGSGGSNVHHRTEAPTSTTSTQNPHHPHSPHHQSPPSPGGGFPLSTHPINQSSTPSRYIGCSVARSRMASWSVSAAAHLMDDGGTQNLEL